MAVEPDLHGDRAHSDVAFAVNDPVLGVHVPGGLEGRQGGTEFLVQWDGSAAFRPLEALLGRWRASLRRP
jgi:hypothetical protein